MRIRLPDRPPEDKVTLALLRDLCDRTNEALPAGVFVRDEYRIEGRRYCITGYTPRLRVLAE